MEKDLCYYELLINTHDSIVFTEHFAAPKKISLKKDNFSKEIIPFVYDYLKSKIPLFSKEKKFKIFHDFAYSRGLYDNIAFYIIFENSNIYWKATTKPLYFEDFQKLAKKIKNKK